MRWLTHLSILFFSVPLYCFSQGGFSNTYDLGGRAATFKNCILVGDTLVITGTFLPDNSPWNALLVRMDTLGQLIDFHSYQDTSGDYFSQSLNVDIIKAADGGYLITGSLIFTNNGVIIKTDNEKNLEFYKKYPDDKYFSPRRILELPDGYLVLGTRQRVNFKLDVYIMKTDKSGDIVWEKYLGDWEMDDSGGNLVMLDSNHFVVGGFSGIASAPNMTQAYTRTKFWFIDSLGNSDWEWQSFTNTEAGASGLQRLADGDWLYCTRTYEAFGPLDFGGQCKIVRRDSNMNLVWERVMLHAVTTGNALWDIKPTPDGNWVAVGNWIPFYSENPDSISYLAGVLHKFSSDGDSIWTVVDTAFWHPVYGSENYLGGAVVLPSGSVIAVGYSTNFYGQPKSWAWMLKVDKDGCVDTLCTVVGSGEAPLPARMEIRAFPNPADDAVKFAWGGVESAGNLVITDVAGKTVLNSGLSVGQTSLIWNTGVVAPGVYFYRFQWGTLPAESGKIIVRH